MIKRTIAFLCALLLATSLHAAPADPSSSAVQRIVTAVKKRGVANFMLHVPKPKMAELHYHVMTYTVKGELKNFYPDLEQVKGPAADGVMVLVLETDNIHYKSWPIEKGYVSAFRKYSRPHWQETRFLLQLEKGGAVITVRTGPQADPGMVKAVINDLLQILRPDMKATP